MSKTEQDWTSLRRSAPVDRLDGKVIVDELIRNMELGRFEMAYAVLLPCVFTIYLNPQDFSALSGVLDLVKEDARKALRAKVADWNGTKGFLGTRKASGGSKEYKIACREWEIDFFPDVEIATGDVEIHSELNEVVQPGFRGVKTTLIGREKSDATRLANGTRPERASDAVHASIEYEDDSGRQIFQLTGNSLRVGRGGEDQSVDLELNTSDEVSRAHLVIRRDPGTGAFFLVDTSTNGTWLNGRRLAKGSEELLPSRAQISLGEVVTLHFEAKK